MNDESYNGIANRKYKNLKHMCVTVRNGGSYWGGGKKEGNSILCMRTFVCLQCSIQSRFDFWNLFK